VSNATASNLPAGKLEIDVLGDGDVAAAPDAGLEVEDSPERLAERAIGRKRLHVVADAVPLGTFGLALGDKLRIPVVVSPDLVGLRVAVALPDGTVEDLLSLLTIHYAGRAWIRGGVLHIDTWRGWTHGPVELEPLVVEILPVGDGVLPAQVAQAACQAALSERGSISVVGRRLVVRDVRSGVNRVSALTEALRGTPARAAGASGQAAR
jgi:hypothetical protein